MARGATRGHGELAFGRFSHVAWRVGRGGGSCGVVGCPCPHAPCGRCPPRGLSAPWGGPAVLRPTALRCSAVGRVAELTALTLRSDSRDKFEVEVRWRAPAPRLVRLATPQTSHPHGPPATPLTQYGWCARDEERELKVLYSLYSEANKPGNGC